MTYYARKSDWAAAKAEECRAAASREAKAYHRSYRSKQAIVDSYRASERQWLDRAERYRREEAGAICAVAA